jgi:hypothetical protein
VSKNPKNIKITSTNEYKKAPINIFNSLIKLKVLGNPILANKKNNKQNEYKGITIVKPL